MKIATLDLAPELFIEFCKLCKNGPSRRYIVKQNALPDDAEVVEVRLRSYATLDHLNLERVN